MAAILKTQYNLAVLQVSLLPGGFSNAPSPDAASTESMAMLRFEMQGHDGSGPVHIDAFDVPARAMGIPRRLDLESIAGRGQYRFELPADLSQWVGGTIGQVDRPGGVLWLHLVKPYGYLGMFPWERLLQPVLGCPVLRLPDFVIDPPQQTPSVVDVALCCQLGNADSAAIDLLVKSATAILQGGSSRKVRVTALVDSEVYAKLSPITKDIPGFSCREVELGESLLTTYVVNPIAAASSFVSNPIRDWLRKFGNSDQEPGPPSSKSVLAAATDPVQSPWLRAARKALGEQSVDVVHVLSNAMLSLENGVLLLDQTDLKSKNPNSHAVSAREFLAFQAQVGAWAAGFSSAPNSLSDMGLRQFADSLAQLRPGPLLYHDAVADPGCGELSNAYAFLLSVSPTTPVQYPASFVYCEPFRVYDDRKPDATLESLSNADGRKDTTLRTSEAIRSVFANTDNVPSWVAASERFIDIYKMRLAELSSKGESVVRPGQLDEIRSTLTRLQDTVAKVMKDGGS